MGGGAAGDGGGGGGRTGGLFAYSVPRRADSPAGGGLICGPDTFLT